MEVKISDIVVDKDVYPRVQDAWLKAYEYSQAMKADAVFPAIKLGNYKGKLILIDGLHRLNANKLLKNSKINADITDYKDKKTMFLDAIKANNLHGKPLTLMDKTLIFKKLRELRVDDSEISNLLGTPKEKFSVYVTRLISNDNLEKPVKEVVSDALERGLITEKEAFDLSDLHTQNMLVSHDVTHALQQTLKLLTSGLIDLENTQIKEMCVEIYNILGTELKLDASKPAVHS